jgi:hypothetical protein
VSFEKARWWWTWSMLAPLRGDAGGDLREGSGQVGDFDGDAREPPRANHASFDDPGEHEGIDVPAAEHEADFPAPEAARLREQRRERRGAGALDHRLLDLEEHHDRLLDLAFLDEEHLGHEPRDDLARERPGLLHGDALGDGGRLELGLGALERVIHGREALRLDADELDRGLQALRRGGDPGNESASADRDDQHVQLGPSGEHLEADRALPRDDLLVVVGMDERESAFAADRRGSLPRPERSSPSRITSAPCFAVCSTFTNGV